MAVQEIVLPILAIFVLAPLRSAAARVELRRIRIRFSTGLRSIAGDYHAMAGAWRALNAQVDATRPNHVEVERTVEEAERNATAARAVCAPFLRKSAL